MIERDDARLVADDVIERFKRFLIRERVKLGARIETLAQRWKRVRRADQNDAC